MEQCHRTLSSTLQLLSIWQMCYLTRSCKGPWQRPRVVSLFPTLSRRMASNLMWWGERMEHEYSVALICHAGVHRWSLNDRGAQDASVRSHTAVPGWTSAQRPTCRRGHWTRPLTGTLPNGTYMSPYTPFITMSIEMSTFRGKPLTCQSVTASLHSVWHQMQFFIPRKNIFFKDLFMHSYGCVSV